MLLKIVNVKNVKMADFQVWKINPNKNLPSDCIPRAVEFTTATTYFSSISPKRSMPKAGAVSLIMVLEIKLNFTVLSSNSESQACFYEI